LISKGAVIELVPRSVNVQSYAFSIMEFSSLIAMAKNKSKKIMQAPMDEEISTGQRAPLNCSPNGYLKKSGNQ